MRWTERQRAMLREMGIEIWAREAPPAGLPDASGAADVRGPVAGAVERREGQDRRATPRPAPPLPAVAPALAAADWLVVGDAFVASDESAADQERLMDNMLAAIGVSRTAPTRRQRAAFLALPDRPQGDGAKPRALLKTALDAVQPACILALGRAAAQALLDTDEPLGALRGRREAHAGIPVVVTFSPAFLLRHPADKAKAWADLCLAVRCVDEAAAPAPA